MTDLTRIDNLTSCHHGLRHPSNVLMDDRSCRVPLVQALPLSRVLPLEDYDVPIS